MCKISVCMATYNGEQYVKEQIQSILRQIPDDSELIISDDGSTDGTVNEINSIEDGRITLLNNNEKHGIIGNFSNAINNSSGDFIFLSDQDDVWLDGKVETMMNYLQSYDLVHCDSAVTDKDLNIIYDSIYKKIKSGPGLLKNIIRSTYYGSHMAFRRKIYEDAKPFPDKYIDGEMAVGYDLWLGLVAEITGSVKFIDKQLMLYRRNNNSYVSPEFKSDNSLVHKLLRRFYMISYIEQYKKNRLKTQ